MSFNWEDALDDEDNQFTFKKEGDHTDEVIEVKKPVVVKNNAPVAVKAPKPEGAPKQSSAAETAMTPEEIEKKARAEDAKNFGEMFDEEQLSSTLSALEKDEDIATLVKVITEKIHDAPRKRIVAFIKRLGGAVEPLLRTEEVSEISNYYVDMVNTRTARKGAKKKATEVPSMKKVGGGYKNNVDAKIIRDFIDEEGEEVDAGEELSQRKDYDYDFM